MPLDPWSYAEKSGTEHAHQTALFMWANMACRFGAYTANFPAAYTEKGWAANYSKHAIETGNDFLIPQLKWLHAIHNQGHGDAIRGGKAKAEGVKAGISDLFLPVPTMQHLQPSHLDCRYYCGLYLELKVGNNKPSEIQLEFMNDMRAAGYAADWAIGWLDARYKILTYLQVQ
jgi:hypothetical protein